MPKKQPEQMLDLQRIVRREYDVRSNTDRRVKVDIIIAEYVGEQDGETYRKSFENKAGRRVEYRLRGTHATLNGDKIQWR
ncbi:MAG TPA: hypothetical protein VF521_19510 [Pyrinomonadaceae bacterium]|jgi:hypothetical protein